MELETTSLWSVRKNKMFLSWTAGSTHIHVEACKHKEEGFFETLLKCLVMRDLLFPRRQSDWGATGIVADMGGIAGAGESAKKTGA